MIEINVKLLNDKAVLPFKNHKEDYCYDVTAISEEEIAPNVWKYGIGLSFQISRGIFAQYDSRVLSIDLRSRSSIWKTGMILSNGTGTIDELFTGEVSAVFYHVMTNLPRYKVGDRIGQIKVGETHEIQFQEVNELTDTERGHGSYGSTGI